VASNADEELEIISHTLQCTLLALPDSLKYHNEPLRFTSVSSDQIPTSFLLHHAKYSIFVMAELTKFMIAHYHTFYKDEKITRPLQSNGHVDLVEANREPGTLLMCTTRKPNMDGLMQYVEASNNIVMLLNRCSSTHIRYVNPFLATTIWLAATVQLLNKKFGPPGGSRELAEAKFHALRLTYKQFVRFWNTPAGLLLSLDSLEERFDHLLGAGRASGSVDKNSGQGDHHCEQAFNNGPGTSIRFAGSLAPQKGLPVSYTSALTEPNLTGSGVNSMIGSLVHSSQTVDEQQQRIAQNFDSSVTQLQQPAPSTGNNAEPEGDQMQVHVQFDHRDPADPMLDTLEIPMNFDYDDGTDLTAYLNTLLSGSYSGSLGPS
jgi:hypothetical protein